MKKTIWLLGHDLSKRFRYSPVQVIITVLGLCISALTCIGCIQYILKDLFRIDEEGHIRMLDGIQRESVVVFAGIASLFLAFALVNVILLFRHLTGSRRKQYLIYKMYGCSRGELFFLPFAEQSIYLLLGGVLAVGIYVPTAAWLEHMYCTVYPQAYWGIAIYTGAVLIVSIVSSLTAAGVRLNKREG